MQHLGFRYAISIEVVFHPVDLILLRYAAKRHYDHACQDLLGPDGALRTAMCYLTDPDGNWVDPDEPLNTFLGSHPALRSKFFLTFRELDTMAKTMEYYETGAKVGALMRDIGLEAPDEADPRLVEHVNDALRAALRAINQRHSEVAA